MVALVVRPTAYRQTSGPNGVMHVAIDRRRQDDEHPAATWSTAEEVVHCREADGQRGQEEAAVEVRPGEHDQREQPDGPGMLLPHRQDRHDGGEADDSEQLRPKGQRADPEQEAGKREVGRPPAVEVRPAANEDQARDDGDQERPQQGEPAPPQEAVNERHCHTRPPLLVEPWVTERGEGEGVCAQNGAGRQHQLAGPQLVGEVPRGQRGDRGREGRQQDREGKPEAVARHVGVRVGDGTIAV